MLGNKVSEKQLIYKNIMFKNIRYRMIIREIDM